MCVRVFVCVFFTWKGASVTAINVSGLQTPYRTLMGPCACNSPASSGTVVESFAQYLLTDPTETSS